VQLRLAEVLESEGQLSAAVRMYQRVLLLQHSNVPALRGLGGVSVHCYYALLQF
jgi:hypothetical protein